MHRSRRGAALAAGLFFWLPSASFARADSWMVGSGRVDEYAVPRVPREPAPPMYAYSLGSSPGVSASLDQKMMILNDDDEFELMRAAAYAALEDEGESVVPSAAEDLFSFRKAAEHYWQGGADGAVAKKGIHPYIVKKLTRAADSVVLAGGADVEIDVDFQAAAAGAATVSGLPVLVNPVESGLSALTPQPVLVATTPERFYVGPSVLRLPAVPHCANVEKKLTVTGTSATATAATAAAAAAAGAATTLAVGTELVAVPTKHHHHHHHHGGGHHHHRHDGGGGCHGGGLGKKHKCGGGGAMAAGGALVIADGTTAFSYYDPQTESCVELDKRETVQPIYDPCPETTVFSAVSGTCVGEVPVPPVLSCPQNFMLHAPSGECVRLVISDPLKAVESKKNAASGGASAGDVCPAGFKLKHVADGSGAKLCHRVDSVAPYLSVPPVTRTAEEGGDRLLAPAGSLPVSGPLGELFCPDGYTLFTPLSRVAECRRETVVPPSTATAKLPEEACGAGGKSYYSAVLGGSCVTAEVRQPELSCPRKSRETWVHLKYVSESPNFVYIQPHEEDDGELDDGADADGDGDGSDAVAAVTDGATFDASMYELAASRRGLLPSDGKAGHRCRPRADCVVVTGGRVEVAGEVDAAAAAGAAAAPGAGAALTGTATATVAADAVLEVPVGRKHGRRRADAGTLRVDGVVVAGGAVAAGGGGGGHHGHQGGAHKKGGGGAGGHKRRRYVVTGASAGFSDRLSSDDTIIVVRSAESTTTTVAGAERTLTCVADQTPATNPRCPANHELFKPDSEKPVCLRKLRMDPIWDCRSLEGFEFVPYADGQPGGYCQIEAEAAAADLLTPINAQPLERDRRTAEALRRKTPLLVPSLLPPPSPPPANANWPADPSAPAAAVVAAHAIAVGALH